MKIFFVSSNIAKFKEMKNFFDHHIPSLICEQKNFDVPEIQSLDLTEVASAKALQAWNHVQAPVIVDDSGIFFDHYPLFPGTLSRYIYKALGFNGLLKLSKPGSCAEFRTCIIYCEGPGKLFCFTGVCRGILCEPSGKINPDFPYCSMFIPEGYTKPYSELCLTQEEDERLNQRHKALKKLADWLLKERIFKE